MKVKLKRNRHNLSHYRLGTCFPGELIPVGCVEVLPGDTFQHRVTSLVRFLPMNAPIMHRVQCRIHHFYVPMRILWSGFEAFITRAQGGPTAVPSFNVDEVIGNPSARLFDYFGINTSNVTSSDTGFVSKLSFAAYNKIFNEWYRDQDLVAPLNDDAQTLDQSDLAVRRCAWQKDYFTSARPWPQKGPDITLPLGIEAPIIVNPERQSGTGNFLRTTTGGDGDTGINLGSLRVDTTTTPMNVAAGASPLSIGSPTAFVHPNNQWVADLADATAVDVNTVRRAFALQRFAERLSQFGSRTPELLASMGVKSSDSRLQIPEYLGGGKMPLNFSEVLQTAPGDTTEVGDMYGHGISPGSTRSYRRFFEEWGYVISIMSIRPQLVYSNAVPRQFFHGLVDGPNDIYTPELERIGQQEIYNKEVFLTGEEGNNDVWGYQDRYAEYRHQPSQVSGDLQVGEQLDYWTWARGFESLPALNSTFTTCNPDPRIFADTVDAPIIFGVNHHLIAQRMLTKNTVGRIL